ncbi:MAG: hypothetical protein QXF61_09120 [Nitrososphaeria archaeon]
MIDNEVDRRKMRKWIRTKILNWDEVVHRLEEIYTNKFMKE